MRPVLIIVAGPNGSGKTSLTRTVLGHNWVEGCHYVNPDDIALDMFGNWNDPECVLKAAKEATRQCHECLRLRQSLAFETVFSSPAKLQFLHDAKDAGFFVRMFFVGTDDPDINAARILNRVKEGGHGVPVQKIHDRFGKSLANLAAAIPLCDRTYVYDNSVDLQKAELQFRCVDGNLEKTYGTAHSWAETLRTPLSGLPKSRADATERSGPEATTESKDDDAGVNCGS